MPGTVCGGDADGSGRNKIGVYCGIHLIIHLKHRFAGNAQLLQQPKCNAILSRAFFRRLARIDEVDNDVGKNSLLERGLKRFDQMRRQTVDETDGISQQHLAAARKRKPPRSRVECSEKLILCEDTLRRSDGSAALTFLHWYSRQSRLWESRPVSAGCG